MNTVIAAVLLLFGLGILFGAGLAIASRKLAVETDPRIDQIEELLPGANCGGCGFPGCRGLAEAIVEGSAPVDSCPVTKDCSALAEVMGVEPPGCERRVAKVRCIGGKKEAKERFAYIGSKDCFAAQQLAGGPKVCEYGCLGLGSCVEACPFSAISINENGLAVVDEEKCTGCGQCVSACPRGLIALSPAGEPVTVFCQNKEKGGVVRKICRTGCIGCGICAKQCEQGAITLENNLAVIDPEKCNRCGRCIAKCPVKVIRGAVAEVTTQTASGGQ